MIYLITYLMVGLGFGIFTILINFHALDDLGKTREAWNAAYDKAELGHTLFSESEVERVLYLSIVLNILIWPIGMLSTIYALYKYVKNSIKK